MFPRYFAVGIDSSSLNTGKSKYSIDLFTLAKLGTYEKSLLRHWTKSKTHRLLTNSFVQSSNSFPFHGFHKTIQKSFVHRFVNGLCLETNLEGIEWMTNEANSYTTKCSRN